MKIYSNNGLTLFFPDELQLSGCFGGVGSYLYLTHPRTSSQLVVMVISEKIRTFEALYNEYYDPANPIFKRRGTAILTAGDYLKFSGAKEIATRDNLSHGNISYIRKIFIPMGVCAIEIIAHEGFDEIYMSEIWNPIIDGLQLDLLAFKADTPPNMKKVNWAGHRKSSHFNAVFHPEHGFVQFYDSQNGDLEFDIDENDMLIKAVKTGQAVTLLPDDVLTVVVDFYKCQYPPEQLAGQWVHAVEGVIGIGSGQLLVGDGMSPLINLKLTKGNYSFRCYYGQTDCETDTQHLALYFWPANETQANGLKAINLG